MSGIYETSKFWFTWEVLSQEDNVVLQFYFQDSNQVIAKVWSKDIEFFQKDSKDLGNGRYRVPGNVIFIIFRTDMHTANFKIRITQVGFWTNVSYEYFHVMTTDAAAFLDTLEALADLRLIEGNEFEGRTESRPGLTE